MAPNPNLQDFSLVNTHVTKVTKDQSLSATSLGFCFFALDLLLGLQEDEIDDAITDAAYLSEKGRGRGHDRGIDAVHIDDAETPAVVHLFSFKYTEHFKKTSNNFPSNEINKIISFISAVMQQDEEIENDCSQVLFSKFKDILNLFENHNPRFVIHICSNFYSGFEEQERKRFEREMNKFSNFEIKYHLITDFVTHLTKKDKQEVDGKIRAIGFNLFEKTDGDIRALIANVDARDLLRIVLNSEELRDSVDAEYSELKDYQILEDAFEDNVRVYLKQRSKINRNIKETALSEDDAHRFFYFNNGVTITCSHYNYPKKRRNPIIELQNLQVVNGSQTIHALFDAFKDNHETFDDLEILCRVYETRNEELSTNIAEYTNSQNPVKSRDIRSNDYVQKKLESELKVSNYFYERKKAQYSNESKEKRIDAEKAGQVLLTFYNGMPGEAKNKKRIIFAEKYEDIFTDNLTADALLLAFRLFNTIEERKALKRAEIQSSGDYEVDSFIVHASYYILHVLSKLAEARGIEKIYSNYQEIEDMYSEAVELIRESVESERKRLSDYQENYSHRIFFQGNRPKNHLQESLKEVDIETT